MGCRPHVTSGSTLLDLGFWASLTAEQAQIAQTQLGQHCHPPNQIAYSHRISCFWRRTVALLLFPGYNPHLKKKGVKVTASVSFEAFMAVLLTISNFFHLNDDNPVGLITLVFQWLIYFSSGIKCCSAWVVKQYNPGLFEHKAQNTDHTTCNMESIWTHQWCLLFGNANDFFYQIELKMCIKGSFDPLISVSFISGLGFSCPQPVFVVQNGINWDKPVFPSFPVQNWEKLSKTGKNYISSSKKFLKCDYHSN